MLGDVFQNFRNNSWKNYGLCSSHFLSAPGLSWDAMFNMTKVELELIPNPDMYISFQKGKRGGVSYISNRYSKANNKYIKSYDAKQQPKNIIYLDANNLDGYLVTTFLPTSDFKWIYPAKSLTSINILAIIQKDVLKNYTIS